MPAPEPVHAAPVPAIDPAQLAALVAAAVGPAVAAALQAAGFAPPPPPPRKYTEAEQAACLELAYTLYPEERGWSKHKLHPNDSVRVEGPPLDKQDSGQLHVIPFNRLAEYLDKPLPPLPPIVPQRAAPGVTLPVPRGSGLTGPPRTKTG
jgi:hypothetical protein